MPGNPVASTPGVSHSKSFRSRLGFGGGGGLPSNKSSFFSLKSGRKSFGGPGELKLDERPVFVIDSESDHGRGSYEDHVVLNDEPDQLQLFQQGVKPYRLTNDFRSQLPRSNVSHSLPASPTRNAKFTPNSRIPKFDFQSPSINGAKNQADSDQSGLSKHLPDISSDLSLLVNEPPLDTMSQSDFHESKTSRSEVSGPAANATARETTPAPGPPPTALDKRSQPQFPISQETVHQIDHTVSSISDPEGDEGVAPRLIHGAIDNTSISFDLSTAKFSLDLMRDNFGDDWARNVLVENSAVPSANTSASHDLSPSPLAESNSGPVTSTPFLHRTRPQDVDADASFNLDALDPDLVALLRPNTFKDAPLQVNRDIVPSALEPFAPPPDPLNPDTTVKRPSAPATSPSVPSTTHCLQRQMDGAAHPPVRKYATLTASSSIRPSRLPRSNAAQELVTRTANPSTAEYHPDLYRLQIHTRLNRQPSPPALTSYPDSRTLSDASKQPSPLSATPLTPDNFDRPGELAPPPDLPVGAIAQAHMIRPGSAFMSSTDSRPAPRFSPQDRGSELRQISSSPISPGPIYASGSLGRERERTRPSLDGLFPTKFSPERSGGHPSSSNGGNSHNILHCGPSLNGAYTKARERGWDISAGPRCRKRSMSLDQSSEHTSASGGRRGAGEDFSRPGGVNSRVRLLGDRDRVDDWASSASDVGYRMGGGLDATFDGRYREREPSAPGHGDRERYVKPDWLGPRTAKAFAAAGLLEDQREPSGSRYGAVSRSTSERDFRAVGTGNWRDRDRWIPMNARTLSADGEIDRGQFRHNFLSGARNNGDREVMSPMMRTGAETPSTASMTRPPSSGDSSHSRSAQPFTRTMSELPSYRGNVDRLENTIFLHHRPGSAYSPSGVGTTGGSAGSGGGRASPTTTSSLVAAQSQIQILKEKHDNQTEALLAALADSQRTTKELKEENESLKGQVRMLEERLVETIANSRQKEKEFARSLRTRSPEHTQTMRSRRNPEFWHIPPAAATSKTHTKLTPTSTKRRLSTSSSVFPTVPTSMSLLMAETPGSPPPNSLTFDSHPPSPTLVPPRPATIQKSPERSEIDGNDTAPSVLSHPVPISHKRSTSGTSVATSTNFSFETGSPGSLKLKPEHELLLGDMTKLSLVTGFGGESEIES